MKRVTYAGIALLAAVGVGLAGCNKEETKQAADDTKNAAKDAGKATTQAAKDVKDTATKHLAPSGSANIDDVKVALEGVVEKVSKRNEWNAMADWFTAADATRVKAGKPESKDLDDLAESFGKVWSQKYGGDTYDVMKAKTVFAPDFMTVASDPSTQDRATGTIKESHGMPSLPMNFISEGGKWRLDIPDTVTAQKFHDNLKAALAELQDSTKWPDKKEEGYRHVAHRVLLGVMDKAGPGGTASVSD